MGKYVFAFKGGGMPETEEEQKSVMDAWTAWFGSLGDCGRRHGQPVRRAGRGRRRRHVRPDRLLDRQRGQPRRRARQGEGLPDPRTAAAAASRCTRRSRCSSASCRGSRALADGARARGPLRQRAR